MILTVNAAIGPTTKAITPLQGLLLEVVMTHQTGTMTFERVRQHSTLGGQTSQGAGSSWASLAGPIPCFKDVARYLLGVIRNELLGFSC